MKAIGRGRRSDYRTKNKRTAARVKPRLCEKTKTRRPDLKVFMIVGGYFLSAYVVLVGVLSNASQRVGAAVLSVISVVGFLFVVLLFGILARFSGVFGDETAERMIDKVMDKVPGLKGNSPSSFPRRLGPGAAPCGLDRTGERKP
jgi:hypothetical protein